MKKIVLVASGLSANQFYDYDYKGNGWQVLAVNNGWLSCEDSWDFWVRSNDYKGRRPIPKHKQHVVKRYGPSLRKYGGQLECGYSITLNSAYWALDQLSPSLIGFLGADMNYTPNEEGHTHIYGVGDDIKRNGIPNPDRMVVKYGEGNKNYLTDIYARFSNIAAETDCIVVNLSRDVDTRLPYERVSPKDANNRFT
jgi:hypothetical protein